MSHMTLTTEGDCEVVVRRRFAASPQEVYDAHLDPELIPQWMTGPDAWTMPVCRNDGRVGGQLRYEWAGPEGQGFHLTGELLVLEPGRRIVHVERMFLPDPTPDNRVETIFQADGGGTLMTMRMTLPDPETRRAMLASGMEHGMEAGYVRLEDRLAGRRG